MVRYLRYFLVCFCFLALGVLIYRFATLDGIFYVSHMKKVYEFNILAEALMKSHQASGSHEINQNKVTAESSDSREYKYKDKSEDKAEGGNASPYVEHKDVITTKNSLTTTNVPTEIVRTTTKPTILQRTTMKSTLRLETTKYSTTKQMDAGANQDSLLNCSGSGEKLGEI